MGRRGPPRGPSCTNGCTDRRCNGPCDCPGPALRWKARSAAACGIGPRQGLRRDSTDASSCRAHPLLRRAGVVRRRVRPVVGVGRDADPASLAPAGAAVYAEAAVQPTGDRRDDALAAAGKLLRTDDPAGKLRAEIDKALAEEGDGFTWEKDFAPWLGEDAGVWASNLAADEPDYAVIVATKDTDAAKAALQRFKDADEDTGPYTKKSHEGVDYEVDAENTAIGLVGDFLVIGTETGVQAHGRHGQGRRQPRRRRPLSGRRRRPRRRQPRPLLRRRQGDHRRRDQGGPGGGAAARAGQGHLPGRQARAGERLVPGRRRRHVDRHRAHRHPRGAVPPARRRCGRAASPSCSASCPPTRGRRSPPPRSASRQRRSSTRSPGRSGARRSPRRSSRRPGSTSSRTSSPGSATSASSRAGRPSPTSTARSSSRRPTTPRRRPPSASSSA